LAASERTPVSGELAVGDVLDDTYEIVAPIGHGGMGFVYEARDRRLGRRVAVKIARGDAASEALRNEARALASIRHPNLVAVYAAGQRRFTDYVVMELLRGTTLEERIEREARAGKTVPLDEALELLVAITSALAALHGFGIAHRDLKPANVVLAGGRVVLIDLGLFIPEFGVSSENPVGGSPEYIAPEVLLHVVEPGGGPLVDLYALGILGYELLTGAPPFSGPDVGKIVARHIGERVPDVRKQRPEVPPKLSQLLRELVEKEPGDRTPSSEAALWRLEAIRGAPASRRPMRALVIDDDPTVGEVLRRALENALPGLEVRTESDPRAAVESLDRDPVDVVAVDLNMPRMNGLEVCMQIDALPAAKRPAIVAMSAKASARDVDVFRKLGAVRFVPKDYRFVGAMCDVVGSLRRARS
jgi:serine/threonine-protein kinase